MAEKRFLRVRREDTNEIVSEVEVTGKSENQIERIERGILMNMDTDAFILDDSALDCSAD